MTGVKGDIPYSGVPKGVPEEKSKTTAADNQKAVEKKMDDLSPETDKAIGSVENKKNAFEALTAKSTAHNVLQETVDTSKRFGGMAKPTTAAGLKGATTQSKGDPSEVNKKVFSDTKRAAAGDKPAGGQLLLGQAKASQSALPKTTVSAKELAPPPPPCDAKKLRRSFFATNHLHLFTYTSLSSATTTSSSNNSTISPTC